MTSDLINVNDTYRDRVKQFEIAKYKSLLICPESKTALLQLFHES